MNDTPQPVQPRNRPSGLGVCIVATLVAFLAPPLVGFIADRGSDSHGPLGALFTVMGGIAGLVLGSVVLVICAIALLIQHATRPRNT